VGLPFAIRQRSVLATMSNDLVFQPRATRRGAAAGGAERADDAGEGDALGGGEAEAVELAHAGRQAAEHDQVMDALGGWLTGGIGISNAVAYPTMRAS